MKNNSTLLSMVSLSFIMILGAGCASTATQESTGEYIDSTVITAGVKTALAADDITTLLEIEVETYKDTVQLSGFVDSEAERLQAGTVAKGAQGVRTVKNNLVVKAAN